jgi:5-methylcytosine-specific restriction endonuclease McrA
MSTTIPKSLKKKTAVRAEFKCEYCKLAEIVSFYTFHTDHIISTKHYGLTILSNLAYSCPDCNFFKGSDLGTFVNSDEQLTRFFNPRKDKWEDHFDIQNGAIYGKTEIGLATERILQFNNIERLIFRQQLSALSLYP